MTICLSAKGKAAIVEKSSGDNVLQISPKGVEVTEMKIFNAKDEEMVAEEMMLTTGINVQFENLIRFVKPREFKLKQPPSPKELECLGFKIGNMDIKFKKGYVELLIAYKPVD